VPASAQGKGIDCSRMRRTPAGRADAGRRLEDEVVAQEDAASRREFEAALDEQRRVEEAPLAGRRTGSNEAALDLTAETFAQAWIGRRRFRDQAAGTAGPWLFTIARRVLMHSVTRRQLETTMLERLQVELPSRHQADATPDETWLDGLAADMQAALDGLPHEQRRSVELRVLADLPYSRIASRLGCTPTAARIRVSRGLATLRARLEGGRG